jgi:hypothetical protein
MEDNVWMRNMKFSRPPLEFIKFDKQRNADKKERLQFQSILENLPA